ncbi:hypothetical protein GCM10009687_58480 [Asanoa iriomotensis]
MLDALVRRFVAAGAVGAIAARRHGDTGESATFGRAGARREAGPPDADGHFRIGNATTVFTGTLVLHLLPSRGPPAADDHRITLRHPPTHHSGLDTVRNICRNR